MGLVDGHNLDALAIKFQICLRKNLLQGLNEGPEGTALDGLDFKKIAILIGSDKRHFLYWLPFPIFRLCAYFFACLRCVWNGGLTGSGSGSGSSSSPCYFGEDGIQTLMLV
jgi:hypothetical protein